MKYRSIGPNSPKQLVRTHLRCLYLNSRSAAKRGALGALFEHCSLNNIDVVFLSETWFSESVREAEISLRGRYRVWRLDRKSRGGGVCIPTRVALPVTAVSVDCPGEFIIVDIHNDSQSTRLACFYVSNSGDAATRLARTAECVRAIEALCTTDSPILIVGDFNFPDINWNSTQAPPSLSKEAFMASLESNGLRQIVCFPTHRGGGGEHP